jgi:hypothetical protein
MKAYSVDNRSIAKRIRGLIGINGRDDYAFSARRLGVSEMALRMSADELDPHPTFEVLLAVIREYGVDPAWLVTGTYNSGSHRAVLESTGEHDAGRALSDIFAADARGAEFSSNGRLEA